MIEYTKGNLLEADAQALVNTVNTVGVMGKGIALMFKEAFPENFHAYKAACDRGEVVTGTMFVTHHAAVLGPRWIINFPTKKDWRGKSSLKWIEEGLEDLRRVIKREGIHSVAIPPLGSGNGGLDWDDVLPRIEQALSDLEDVHVLVFEPTQAYQNVVKREGVKKLTPARALIAELVRRYWELGTECSVLEIQKLAWLLERAINGRGLPDPLDLRFTANRYGPYADRLRHLLDSMDGSYLRCEKRLADAGPADLIWFEQSRTDTVSAYLGSGETRRYGDALERVASLIDGFESPLGMELLASVDWLLSREACAPEVDAVKAGLAHWPAGRSAADRKTRLFSDDMLKIAISRLSDHGFVPARSQLAIP